MAEHVLQFKPVLQEDLLSEETVLQKDLNTPFVGVDDRPEAYRSLYIAQARMAPAFQKANVQSPLIVNTTRGRGLLWRWWPDSVGVVLMRQAGSEWVLEETVTYLKPEEREHVTFDLTQIVLNPPKWH